MGKVTNKEILERTGLPPMEDLLIRKKSPIEWIPPEDVTRQATKAGSLLSTVFWSQKESAPRLRFKDTTKRNFKLRVEEVSQGTF